MKEYCGIPRTDVRSVACQQYDAFFKFVDASPEHVFFLNGLTADYQEECALFEKAIQHYGGIRLVCTEVDSEGAIGGNAARQLAGQPHPSEDVQQLRGERSLLFPTRPRQ